MKSRDLSLLLRASGNNARTVANCHIFTQDTLEGDDHAFLHEHIELLSADSLAHWLTRDPPRPSIILDELISRAPEGADTSWCSFLIACGWPERLNDGVLDDLTERLFSRIGHDHWWHFARQLRQICPMFKLVLSNQADCEFAARLFPERRDEQACWALLREAAVLGDIELRSREILQKIGFPDGESAVAGAIDYRRKGGERSPQQTLRARASVIAWIEGRGLLHLLAPAEALPNDVRFASEQPKSPPVGPDGYFLELALRWPGDAAKEARSYYIDQFLAAADRGAPLVGLVHELIGSSSRRASGLFKGHSRGDRDLARAILNDIAWRSFDSEAPVPWLTASVLDALDQREPGAWDRAIRYLDRFKTDPAAMNPDLEQRDMSRLSGEIASVGLNGIWSIDWPPHEILLGAPIPEDADDAFDLQFLGRAHLLGDPDIAGSAVIAAHTKWELFSRLASLPLTRSRANRLLAMALDDPEFLEQVAGYELNRIAAVADPVPPERLPAAELFLSRRYRYKPDKDANGLPVQLSSEESYRRMTETLTESVAAYRRLGGAEAEERIQAWLHAPLKEDESSDPFRSTIDDVFTRLEAVPLLLTVQLRRELEARARRLSIRALVDVHKRAPWLIDQESLKTIAVDRAEDATEMWSHFGGVDLPAFLLDAVRKRAWNIENEGEFLALAGWLAKQNELVEDLVSLFLRRIGRFVPTERVIDWLATVLSSRTRWERQGPRVLEPLVEAKAWSSIYRLVYGSLPRGSDTTPPNQEQVRGLVGAIHEAVGVVLLRGTRRALEAGDGKLAQAALQAMVALHPPSRLSGKLNGLRRMRRHSQDVSDLIDLNLRFLRHGSTKEATLSDVRAAFMLLEEASVDSGIGVSRTP